MVRSIGKSADCAFVVAPAMSPATAAAMTGASASRRNVGILNRCFMLSLLLMRQRPHAEGRSQPQALQCSCQQTTVAAEPQPDFRAGLVLSRGGGGVAERISCA